jgi:transposase
MIFGRSRALSVYVHVAPADMRKSFNTLAALVVAELKQAPLSGDLFLFVGKDRKRAKILYFDGTGLCVLAKRLEGGHFMAPWQTGEGELTMTVAELALFFEGSRLEGRLPLSPKPLEQKPVVEM